VCKETGASIWFVDSTEVTMVISTNVESTTCFPHIKGITELAGWDVHDISGVACTLRIDGVPVISSTDGDCGRSDENGTYLGLFHVWAPVSGGGKERFVRTNMFLKLGGR